MFFDKLLLTYINYSANIYLSINIKNLMIFIEGEETYESIKVKKYHCSIS